jgi:hypothetical protein
MLPSPYSAGDKVFEKDLLQVWQKYSCWDMFASAAGIEYNNSRLRSGPDSNREWRRGTPRLIGGLE